ncbi:MAG TPA: hypothetical protein GX692_07975 [Acholeplasmataceae bacterium]|nr:hypothetical protein [Acholeplasmataceae bacterium]
MKFMLAVLSLLTIAGFKDEFITDFDQKVNEAYSEYAVTEYYNQNYGIKLVKGLLDGEVRYGFCFYSENSKDYYVRVSYQNKIYQLPTDGRGDVQAVALNLKEGDMFSIVVYNSRSKSQEPFSEFKNIQIMKKTEFETLEDTFIGLNKGTNLTNLKSEIKFDPDLWLYLSVLGIVLLCALVIFIYYKRRQGLFNQEIRSQNVFNFREFISSNFEVPGTSSQSYEETDFEVIEEDDEEETSSSFFDEHYSWAREEEERTDFDVNSYLQDKGFITDYSILSEEEKNLIMLELMLLRDKKQITRDEYLEETAKLWKK